MSTSSKRFHYGWAIVFSCFVIMCFGMCVVMNCFGLFIKPVTEDLGIGRQEFSMNSTMVSLSMMTVAYFAGKIFSKFNVKRVMMIASIALSLSYACFSFAKNVVMFYVISAAVGFFLALIAQVPCSILVTNWFNAKRGLAMGLVFMGSGIGGMVLNPIIGQLITNVGWRQTYLILGVLMFVTMVPCTFFIIKVKPADKGLDPYGGAAQNLGSDGEELGMTLPQAKRDKRFWLFLSAATMTTATCSAIVQQLTSYVSDIGYSYTTAANISALSLGLLAVGKIILGQIFDKLGAKKATYFSIVCILTGVIALTMAQSVAMLGLFLILFGLGCAFTTVAYPIITTDLFGKKDYSSIYGIVCVASSIGTAVGSPSAAAIYDATGSYVNAWYIGIVFCAINLVSMAVVYRSSKKVQQEAVN